MEASLPFDLPGFDTDKESEFPEWASAALFCGAQESGRIHPVTHYKKNDNSYMEQKNCTYVRQWLGYDRLEEPALVGMIKDLYREVVGISTEKHFKTLRNSASEMRDFFDIYF